MMEEIIEVRWHARAGQGAVTAAKTLAQIYGGLGKYVQAFAEYGAEKRGAPVIAYNRLSDEKLLIHSGARKPSYVLLLDPTLLKVVDIADGTDDAATFIVNSNLTAEKVRKETGLNRGKLLVVDATKIATEEIGRNIPNAPMLGALIKALANIRLEEFLSKFEEKLKKDFTDKVVQGNLKAMRRGYEEVKEG
jgi:pyruvate ferredoxin oxidoreductase gamma subunit